MSKHRPPHYRPGSHLKTCDLSGRVDYAENFVKQWNGLVVHKDYYEPRNPQDFTDAVRDSQSVTNPRQDILTVTTGPQLMEVVRAYVDACGCYVYVIFNRDIDTASSGLSLTADAVSVGINAYIKVGNQLLLQTDDIEAGATALLSYTPGNITPSLGDALAAVTDYPVDNQSALTGVVPLTAYPLDDDGTVAALVGNAWLETNAPDYLQADYTYASPATGSNAIAAPTEVNWLGTQAIMVGAGKVMACEARIISGPASAVFNTIGIAAATSNAGSGPLATWAFGANDATGADPQWVGTGGVIETRAQATANARVGIVFDGDTGIVSYVTADGTYASSQAFTPGQEVTFLMTVADDGTTAAAQTCSLILVPAATDMTLTYPAGAVDVFGDTI